MLQGFCLLLCDKSASILWYAGRMKGSGETSSIERKTFLYNRVIKIKNKEDIMKRTGKNVVNIMRN